MAAAFRPPVLPLLPGRTGAEPDGEIYGEAWLNTQYISVSSRALPLNQLLVTPLFDV